MSDKREEKLLFQALLPETVKIIVNKAEEGGYWAKGIDVPCYSQGENLSELFEVLTKAIYVYYNVPQKFIRELGSYIPVNEMKERVNEQQSPPSKYTLYDILGNQTDSIREIQRVAV
ncbi:MAG: hypothetical protein AAB536_00595 [Patescibacteria group bacterium]